jgi:Leucine-rich repeat (LRR) protein
VTKLHLAHARANGTLSPAVGELHALRELDLNDNAGLHGSLPTEIGALHALSHVYLFGAALSGTLPAQLSQCTALQELEASRCRLSGTLPAELPKTLEYVFLEANRLSGVLPAATFARLRRLKELELSDNRLSGSLPPALAARPLQHLDVQHNRVTGEAARRPADSRCSGGADRYLRGPATNAAQQGSTPWNPDAPQQRQRGAPAARARGVSPNPADPGAVAGEEARQRKRGED